VVGVVPRNHGPTVTLLAAMSHAGITAAMTMTGATDGVVFALFVGQILVPSRQPGQGVIWDNLSVQRNQTLRRSIEAAGGHLRFLPASSPDFSPIEHAFRKRTTALPPGRSAGPRRARGRHRRRPAHHHRQGCRPVVRPLRLCRIGATLMRIALR